MFDLVLKGGRVLDPAQGMDAVADVAFSGGKVAAVGANLGPAAETRDVAGRIVVPGLIDLHTHVWWGGTSLGVMPDDYARMSGCTTLVDAGSAGPGTLHGFRKLIIERSECRVLPFLHISFAGIFGFHPDVNVGESQDLRLLNAKLALQVAKRDADLVVGIKVRVGANTSGVLGVEPLHIALDVAEAAGLPVMTHLDYTPPSRQEVMNLLRPGDILTHCFRPFPNLPFRPDGRIQTDVAAARERGVIFDIGHGKGSFGWDTAMKMVKAGFMPDVISSDVHVVSINGPAYELLTTMTKLLHIGMPLMEVVRAATINPAKAIRLTDRGTLKPGLLGDATVLDFDTGRFELEDVTGEKLTTDRKLACKGIVLGGKWWHG
ncbi:MAG: amidohydrolase/deacetylase family metallohydrolase [Rhodospirillales bacterium]|nr:amidohydrolase/deacetylase family metallohydrolase [Rhodospirillales bacterium]